jgi:hypothetical protein
VNSIALSANRSTGSSCRSTQIVLSAIDLDPREGRCHHQLSIGASRADAQRVAISAIRADESRSRSAHIAVWAINLDQRTSRCGQRISISANPADGRR